MPYLFLTLGLGVFLICFQHLRILPKVKQSLATTHQAVAVLRSAQLSDTEKEAAVQRAALRMGRAFCDILLCSAAALLGAALFAFAGIPAGLYGTGDVVAAGQSPLFLSFLALLAVAALRVAR